MIEDKLHDVNVVTRIAMMLQPQLFCKFSFRLEFLLEGFLWQQPHFMVWGVGRREGKWCLDLRIGIMFSLLCLFLLHVFFLNIITRSRISSTISQKLVPGCVCQCFPVCASIIYFLLESRIYFSTPKRRNVCKGGSLTTKCQ